MPNGLMMPLTFVGTEGTLTFNSDSLFTTALTIDSLEPILRLTTLSDGTVHDGDYDSKSMLKLPVYRRIQAYIHNTNEIAVANKFETIAVWVGDVGTFTTVDVENSQWTCTARMGKISAESDQPIATQKYLPFTWAVIQITDWERVVE
jgi:hypothetical protein